MIGIKCLVILVIVLIIFIIGIIIFNKIMFVNFLKSYNEAWDPIYKNRKKHFDKYLKYALENSKSIEPIENISSFSAHMRIDDNKANNKNYTYWQNYYLHELRSANIESL